MEIQQLRHMLAAAHMSSYAQASKICFTSRQNIAHSIKKIESELSVTLFKREGNKMVLTPEGKQVVILANEVITGIDNMHFMFANPDVQALLLSFAVSTNLFAGIPSDVNALFERHPGGIRVFELDCEDCYRYVCSEKVDVAIVMCMKREFPNCNALEIASSASYALVSSTSSSLSTQMHLSATDLKNHKLLLMSEPDFQYVPLFAQLDLLGFDRANVNVISSTASMIHLLKRSDAVSLVSQKFAVNPPQDTVAIPIFEPQLNWHFYMLYQTSVNNHRLLMKLAMDIRSLFENDGGCGTIRQSF